MPGGILLINKPAGVRSSVCCAIAKRRLNNRYKIGHGGTLDSTAEGLLILLVGGATRASDFVMSLPKVYDAFFFLGEERSTDDYTGDIVFSGNVPDSAEGAIRALLPSFYGVRMQTPPDISAVKVKGKRAHKLTRSGEVPALCGRPVFIRFISLQAGQGRQDVFRLRIICGKGTYVRSVVRDIGRLLGCGAHIVRLVRESIGTFSLESALSYESLEDEGLDLLSKTRPLSSLAENYYRYEAGLEETKLLWSGVAVKLCSLGLSQPGTVSPQYGTVVLGKGLFSFGHILPGALFKPVTNISAEGTE